jgi:hypothetical protein
MKAMSMKPPLPEHILRMIDFAERQKLGREFRTFEEMQLAAERYTERKLHAQIRNLLSLNALIFFESRMDRRTTQRKGAPDFLFAKNGVPVAWECKTGKSKLRPEQEEMLEAMKKNGWHTKVIRSLQEAADDLREITGPDAIR